jgi:hypothetical protein
MSKKSYEEMDNEEFLSALFGDIDIDNTDVVEDKDAVESDVTDENDNENEQEDAESKEEIKESDDNIDLDEETETVDDSEDNEIIEETENKTKDKTESDESAGSKDDTKEEPSEDLEKYKKFYEAVTSGIEIDGVRLDGISDPDKILELQRAAIVNSRKLDEFKEVKPVLKTLKESGLLNDPDKLALALEAINGNTDALKIIMEKNKIDPFEIDMDNVDKNSIDPSKYYKTDVELNFEEFVNEAQSNGVKETLFNNVLETWDDQSVVNLSMNPESRRNIIQHMKTGAFNIIQQEIVRQEMLDINNTTGFKNKSAFDKYAEASHIIANRQKQNSNVTIDEPATIQATKESKAEEIIEEAKPRKESNKRLNKAKKASRVTSTGNRGSTPESKGEVKLNELDNEEFLKVMYSML